MWRGDGSRIPLTLLAIIAAANGLTTPQGIVRVTDAASRRPVILVGTMHYNPHSGALVQGTICAVPRRHGLHAAAIELCPSLWDSTAAAQERTARRTRRPGLQRDSFTALAASLLREFASGVSRGGL